MDWNSQENSGFTAARPADTGFESGLGQTYGPSSPRDGAHPELERGHIMRGGMREGGWGQRTAHGRKRGRGLFEAVPADQVQRAPGCWGRASPRPLPVSPTDFSQESVTGTAFRAAAEGSGLGGPQSSRNPYSDQEAGVGVGIEGAWLWAFRMMESALSTFPSFVIVYSLSYVRLFSTPWMQHTRPPCFYCLLSLIKFMSTELGMPSNQHIHCCLQSFPAAGSFPMSRLFTSNGQSMGASASAPVLPMKIQVYFL